jgi:hypothetical protein
VLRWHDDEQEQRDQVHGQRDREGDTQVFGPPLLPPSPGCRLEWGAQGRGRAGAVLHGLVLYRPALCDAILPGQRRLGRRRMHDAPAGGAVV